MIYSQNYNTPRTLKRTANKGQTTPTTLLTPLEYSEIHGACASTQNLGKYGLFMTSIRLNPISLLMKLNSLFLKNISLLGHFKFPVNFGASMPGKIESPMK